MLEDNKYNCEFNIPIPELGKIGGKFSIPKHCPEGFYWVATYQKKTLFGHVSVRDHCRKVGSYEQQQNDAIKFQREQQLQKERAKQEHNKEKLELKKLKEKD